MRSLRRCPNDKDVLLSQCLNEPDRVKKERLKVQLMIRALLLPHNATYHTDHFQCLALWAIWVVGLCLCFQSYFHLAYYLLFPSYARSGLLKIIFVLRHIFNLCAVYFPLPFARSGLLNAILVLSHALTFCRI